MGNRSNCQSAGSFGSKVLLEAPGRRCLPASATDKTGSYPLNNKNGKTRLWKDSKEPIGVERPNHGRAKWKNQKLARKGHRAMKFSNVLKDAQKQTAAAKEKQQPKRAKGFFGMTKSIFQRKGA